MSTESEKQPQCWRPLTCALWQHSRRLQLSRRRALIVGGRRLAQPKPRMIDKLLHFKALRRINGKKAGNEVFCLQRVSISKSIVQSLYPRLLAC